MIIQSGLGSPTDMEGRMNMGLGPFHNLTQLIPIFHILKIHQLHRRAGNDHPIIPFMLNLRKRLIKSDHMLLRSILCRMGLHLEQLDLDLERRI